MTTICLLCDEPIADDEPVAPTMLLRADGSFERRGMHRECALRDVAGGWGHIVDHEFWCKTVHDTDGGLTRRQSALRVAAWIEENGMPPS